MADPTTNYGWDLPDNGADQDVWGIGLNDVLQDVDDQVKLREDEITATEGDIATLRTDVDATVIVADAALPATGGAMTGRIDAKTATTVATVPGLPLGATEALDFATGNWQKITLDQTLSLTFTNIPNVAGAVWVGVVEIIAAGFAITWVDVDEWAGGTAPTLSAKDVVVLYSHDGGTTVTAFRIAQNIS